jgi:outer membrane protein assembly factor BamD (BamD/ComL family)
MRRSALCAVLTLAALFLCPFRAPAPLIYTPGEGWSYEVPGGKENNWRRSRAKDQLDVAQQAYEHKSYRLAIKAAQRVVHVFPLSDYVPQAMLLLGRCYEARKQDEKAFAAYEQILTKYPKIEMSHDIQARQFAIAVRFLHGEWTKLFGYIPFFPSMQKTADMFDKIVRFGPYGEFGPPAQMDIGAAREKQKDYPSAVKAYGTAADRYSEQPKVAADALYHEALAYNKQAKKADYDQSVAGQAIQTFTLFISLYPDDPRVADAQKLISTLYNEEARGHFRTAQYYEKNKRYFGALVYYNEVLRDEMLLKDAGAPLAKQARERIEAINRRQRHEK